MNTSNAWILTHGFHAGIVKLLGEAVRDEQDKRTVYKSKAFRRYNKRVSQITLIGIVTDSLVNELEAFRSGSEGGTGRRRVELELGIDKPARQKYNLDQFHTHFIMVNGSNKHTVTTFRTDLERELQRFSSVRKNFASGDKDNSSDDEDNHSVMPARNTESTASRMGVPLVALMIQGGPESIHHMWNYLRNRTPVVVVKGSGLAADLFANLYEEVANSSDLEKHLQKLTPEVLKRLEVLFPRGKQWEQDEKTECCNKMIDCMRMAYQDDLSYVTILDLSRSSSDLADIDLYILRAIFSSQQAREMDWKEQIKHDLLLCLQWNRPDFARDEIMQRLVKMKIDKDVFQLSLYLKNREDFVDLILHQGFKTHKFLSHKVLIDLFRYAEDTQFFSVNVLENLLGYPAGAMIGERFLLEDLNWIVATFTRVEGFVNSYELSTNSCGIYSTEPSVAERKALNALIVWSILMGRQELTRVFWKYVEDPIPMAIFVSAMWHGLASFCREPELENQVRTWGRDFGVMGMGVLGMAYKESLDRTFQLLDREFPDFGRRTPVQLAYDARNRWFLAHPCCQKWINRLYMGHIQIASPHPGSPQIPNFVKILLSAFLIFPMFFWIHFPSIDSVDAQKKRKHSRTQDHKIRISWEEENRLLTLSSSGSQLEGLESASNMGSNTAMGRSQDDRRTWLMTLQDDQERAVRGETRRKFLRRLFFGNLTGSSDQFSLVERIYLLWTAPITKFWTFQFFYWLYLGLFSVVTLMPVCSHEVKRLFVAPKNPTNISLDPEYLEREMEDSPTVSFIDVVLWCWTALITAETFYRNYRLMSTRHFFHFMTKIMEMIFMVTFLVAYFTVRVIGQQPKLVTAFAARLLMCVGLIYFSYRLIGIFFPISDTLGPMLVRIKFMIGTDFVDYMKLIAPFLIAGGVTCQAILFPDMPLSREVFRITFHRAFFSQFMIQPISELAFTETCEAKRLNRNEAAYCHAGDYKDPACATVGFWGYMTVIHYMVILKLVLATLLYALFTATQLRYESEADAIWKFERYSVVMEFATRPAVSPPFSILYYIFYAVRRLIRFIRQKCVRSDSPKRMKSVQMKARRAVRHDDFHYWKGLVREYFREEERNKREAAAPQRTLDKVVQIYEALHAHAGDLKQMKERLGDLEAIVGKFQNASYISPGSSA
ncbi:transient receptor potential cation channel subfamily M member 3-like isoform X2 [Paramacrobiotus metropolitanus]|nr:transient receptor potential cation channel subfamily M member 3-like isoform X2 [Paramacrobiotus metropolitanus]